MRRSRAENAGRKFGRAIVEMPLGDSKGFFLKGLQSGIGSGKWIHVSEGLPENEGRVKYWVITLDGPAIATWRDYDSGYNWECDTGIVYYWQVVYMPKGE